MAANRMIRIKNQGFNLDAVVYWNYSEDTQEIHVYFCGVSRLFMWQGAEALQLKAALSRVSIDITPRPQEAASSTN